MQSNLWMVLEESDLFHIALVINLSDYQFFGIHTTQNWDDLEKEASDKKVSCTFFF